jgi:hypothetical protein
MSGQRCGPIRGCSPWFKVRSLTPEWLLSSDRNVSGGSKGPIRRYAGVRPQAGIQQTPVSFPEADARESGKQTPSTRQPLRDWSYSSKNVCTSR